MLGQYYIDCAMRNCIFRHMPTAKAHISLCILDIATDKRGYPHNIFLILHENICCGCSLEAPQRGASNEYSQHMFSWRNKKGLFVCVEVLRPSQPNGVMSSAVSLNEKSALSVAMHPRSLIRVFLVW